MPCDRDDDNTEDQSTPSFQVPDDLSIPSIMIENVDEEENTEDQSIPSIMVEKVNEEENTGPSLPLKFLMS